MYEIIIIVLIGLLIFCIVGAIASAKHTNKLKSLQASADYSFQTQKGAYRFNYVVKGFNDENGKIIKIIISPVLGFSDLKYDATNGIQTFSATINGESLVQSFDINGGKLNPALTIEVPSSYLNNGVLNATIEVTSSWSLGDNIVNDALKFDFNK